MNCPGHIQIFKQGMQSYRELPIRMAEFGSCHRYEPSGALARPDARARLHPGRRAYLLHARNRCRAKRRAASRLIFEVYKELGFDECRREAVATRPEKRIGTDRNLGQGGSPAGEACDQIGVAYTINPGEGAFYGPKLEFTLHDAIGREWQCGTVQVDFNLPERLDAEYIARGRQRASARPCIHRAVAGLDGALHRRS